MVLAGKRVWDVGSTRREARLFVVNGLVGRHDDDRHGRAQGGEDDEVGRVPYSAVIVE